MSGCNDCGCINATNIPEVPSYLSRQLFPIAVDHGGQRVLRRSRDENNQPRPPDLGAFAAPTAQSILTKATRYL